MYSNIISNYFTTTTVIPSETVPESMVEAVTEAAETFAPMNFISNLHHMFNGMLGIFVVIGLIITVTFILNKATSKKK